jgi:hypothetical protein
VITLSERLGPPRALHRLYVPIRNAALLLGALRAVSRHQSPDSAGVGLEDKQREMLETLTRRPWRLVSLAPIRLLARSLPLLAILIAYALGVSWAPERATNDYFSAAAQVIPVLLLALAVESRLLSFRSLFRVQPAPILTPLYRDFMRAAAGETEHRALTVAFWLDDVWGWILGVSNAFSGLAVGLAVLLLLSLAEWECLRNLAAEGRRPADPSAVSGGILAGLVGVALIALMSRPERDGPHTP